MHAKIVTFAAGALFVLGNAVPLNNGKRDLVWVTEIATAVETIPVTTTVWVDPTGAPEAHGHGHRAKHHYQSQSSQSAAVEVKPTPSPESSSSISVEQAAYSAPAAAPSSYEAPAYEAPSSSAEPTTESTTEAAPSTTAQAQQTTSTTPEPAPATTSTTEAYVAPVSSYVAPTSSYVAPVSSYEAPSSTWEAPSSTYEAPAASSAPASYGSSSGSDSSNPASGKTFSGEVTYFTPGMGACGETSGEGDKMVAISMALFDQYTPNGNPNKNPLCGKTLTIKGADGAEHKATIWDRCVGCAMDDLDMPQEFFNEVTTPSGSSTPADGRAYGYEWSMN
jgi:hypothetical protein